MRRTKRIRGGAIVLAACVSATVAAQQGGTVPRDVIAILLEGLERSTDGFELRVGDTAAGFPRDLLPGSATIALSAAGDGTTTVVATMPELDAAGRADYEQRLAAGGWINPRRPSGFVPALAGPLVSVCRGSEFATVSFSPRPGGGSYVRAAVTVDPRRGCEARPAAAHAEVPLPSLTPPEGAVTARASVGGTSDAVYSTVRIRTGLGVEAVGAHYADQLAAAGWHVEGRGGDDDAVSMVRLRTTGPGGAPATGLLVVTAIDGTGELDVMLRVVRHTDRR